jgi:ABC-2 type transport system ATP-binding protein
MPSVESLRRSHEILDFCGMKQERYREIDTYSTGMRQKIKFAAAIAHDPEYLILDEPTSGLDPEERDALLSRIKLLSDQAGKSVLISTHILPDVRAICDEIVILAAGKVHLHKPLKELSQTASPSFTVRIHGNSQTFLDAMQRDGFIGQPAENSGWSFESPDPKLLNQIWRCLNETNSILISLTQAKNSLEQIFMQTVREANNGGIDAHS